MPDGPRLPILAAFVGAISVLLTSCLAPDEHDPTGNEPIGRLDVIEAAGSSVRVAGWAIDPNTMGQINVTVAYLGINVKVLAGRPRPDVAVAYPRHGGAHGFDFTTPSLGSGIGQVCVWIDNVGAGSRGRLLGCHDLPLKSDNSVGSFETASAQSPRSVRVSGWGLDPETPNPIDISWNVNGGNWTNRKADLPRSDVNRSTGHRGNHGFSFDVEVVPGRNTVCIKVPPYGRGPGKDLGCRTVINETDDSVTPIAAGRDLETVLRVKPPQGHALAEMSRDAGVSTRLSDGSVMWFFGDTTGFRPDGTLTYFVNNTAAWASGSRPTETRDAIAPGAAPFLAMKPVEDFVSSCPSRWSSVLWPTSAVTVPEPSGQDRVLVYFVNMCLGGLMKFEPRGMGLAEFTYDTNSPPIERQVTGRIVKQTLFEGSLRYGTASLFDGEFVYAYQCRTPEANGGFIWPNDDLYGPCTVARVLPSEVGDLSKYRYWSGANDWSPNRWQTAALDVPAITKDHQADKQMPASVFTIVNDPHHGYLMVYTPWPGISDQIMVRRGESPVGPWSLAQVYKVPGCDDSAGGKSLYCYAATAQPFLSSPTSIGIGYFDDLIALSPSRGGYLAGTVPRRG